jgi:hypothetical protein
MLRRSLYQSTVERGIVSEPFQYIDSLEGKKHIILLYEDPIEGKLIQFRFLRNGLRIGESCFYLTHEEPSIIEKEMREAAMIDVSTSLKKGLHILKIPDISQDKDGMLEGCQKIQKIIQEHGTPYRVVGRIIPDVSTEMAMEVQYALERIFHSGYEGVEGSVLCHYDWTQIGGNRLRWLERLSRAHHAIIFATGFKRGMAFSV